MSLPEVWLRGPMPAIPALLQPAAHALVQAVEEIHAYMDGFPDALVWERPAGVASPGFHVQHMTGVLSRMISYARGEALTNSQLKALQQEGVPVDVSTASLLQGFQEMVTVFLDYLATVPEAGLTDYRPVGRKQLPSTQLGIIFHAAEHTQRHSGQLLVTVRILRSKL
ncbi:MAG TPA: DinB family protein [Flavisolibacter sp.]|nr:DinB family protein [Flavisolibacter sp.]